MVHHRLPAAAVRSRIARAADHIRGLIPGPQTIEEGLELFSLGQIKHIIGVEPEGIIALCPRQRRVAGRGEVINPDKKSNTRAPNSRAISAVRSVDPVSTTTISSKSPATDDRHAGRLFSSSLTIMVSDVVALHVEDL